MVRAIDHPLLLESHLQERVWAGHALGEGIGEAWDLSVHPNGPCQIANGPWSGRTLAEAVAERPQDFGGPIRLLAKRLDCGEDLSVQVHPRSGDPKTEAWVVLGARRGAGVYHGFRRTVTADEVRGAETAAGRRIPGSGKDVIRTGHVIARRLGAVVTNKDGSGPGQLRRDCLRIADEMFRRETLCQLDGFVEGARDDGAAVSRQRQSCRSAPRHLPLDLPGHRSRERA